MIGRISTALLALLLSSMVPWIGGCGGGGGSRGSAPVLASVTPNTGTVGTLVAIAGTGFLQSGSGASTADPVVTFTPTAGGVAIPAAVRSFSATGLVVAVPAVPAALSVAGTAFDLTIANPGGGATTLPGAFTMAIPTVSDVNGGLVGSGTVGSLFIVDGNGFGDLSAAPAAGFSLDFRDATTGSVVASAAVAFGSGDWQDIFIVGTVPNAVAASTTYQVTVTTPSGTSAPRSFLVLGSVSFSPSTIAWTATASLPAPLQGFSAVVAPITTTSGGASSTTSYLYALGGNTGTSGATGARAQSVATVSFNRMSATTGGALAGASWSATTPLPAARGFAAAVGADAFDSLVSGNGNLYVLGGLDATGNATSTVYFASLGADGTVPATASGTWATTTSLPQPLFAASAAIFHGRIYVAGGNDASGAPVATVYSSRIAADGTLGAWQAQPSLPTALAYHQLVTSAGSLYVLGGDTAAVDPVSSAQSSSAQGAIYYQSVDIRDGNLVGATWTVNAAALGKAREKFTAVVAGGYVLVSGGLYNGASTGSSEESYAQIASDGSVGSFNGATGSHTISGAGGYDFFNHAAAYFVDGSGTPHVLVLGGEDVNAGVPRAAVWYQH